MNIVLKFAFFVLYLGTKPFIEEKSCIGALRSPKFSRTSICQEFGCVVVSLVLMFILVIP